MQNLKAGKYNIFVMIKKKKLIKLLSIIFQVVSKTERLYDWIYLCEINWLT